MTKCQFCNSCKTKKLNDAFFCEKCEIYFYIKNGSQLIKSLPIAEIQQRSLNLCTRCNENSRKNKLIKCQVFNEYIRKLPYCKKCKKENYLFLKNLFFKNFLLYKKIGRVFGLSELIVLVVCWFQYSQAIPVLYLYISMLACDPGFFWFIFRIFLLYHLKSYSFAILGMFLVCLYRILKEKTIYFEMPINLYNPEELDAFIDKLNINTSFDRNAHKNKTDKEAKANGYSALKTGL